MICLLVALLGFYGATSATILPCPADKGPMPKSVTIEDCDAPENCELIRGKHFKADVQFTALTELQTMTPQVNVSIGGERRSAAKFETDLPDNRYEGCDWLAKSALQCPIPKGKDTTWLLDIPVSLTDPLVPLNLQVSMFGTDGKPQFCFIILGQVVPQHFT